MEKVKIFADRNLCIGQIDKHIYASFIEHLGRAVYEGIYEPGHPKADADGFRTDVAQLIKELNVPMVRYPGGNFVSNYNWRDGIGPKEKRPTRLDLAWFSTETNQFGTDEFMKWCKKFDIEPMMTVNMGTAGPKEAAELVEYCNHAGGTTISDMRRANGAEDPYNIEYWAIGNEMDGPWQMGHLTAEEYAKKAVETAKMMRWANGEDKNFPDAKPLKLIVSGSSNHDMPTFPEWDRTVLEYTFPYVDRLSMHRYYEWDETRKHPLEDFMGSADDMSAFINEIRATITYVKAKETGRLRRMGSRVTKKQLAHNVYISFDEWNIWTVNAPRSEPAWKKAPHILEDVYTFQDMLVFAGLMNSLLNNCDIVKTACLAQLVNVIAPIMTETGGGTLKQSSYYPFLYVANNGTGETVRSISTSDKFENMYGEARYINEAVTHDAQKREVCLFVCNYDQSAREVEAELRSFGDLKAVEYVEMTHSNLFATNNFSHPNDVVPHNKDLPAVKDNKVELKLPAMSWSYLKFRY